LTAWPHHSPDRLRISLFEQIVTAATGADPKGTLDAALAHAGRLLAVDPALAERQCREILTAVPDHPQALYLEGRARAACRDGPGALAAFGRAVRADPGFAAAWLALADQRRLAGDLQGADQAYDRHIQASVRDPELVAAAAALAEGRLDLAERGLRPILKARPTDVAAIRMLAEVAARLGRYQDAENLLARCLELAPGFTAARHNYAAVLHRHNKPLEALAEIERLLADEPQSASYQLLKAAILGRIGEYEPAVALYEAVLADYPDQPKIWMSYGHALKTVGRQADAVAAYRRCVALQPQFGEAWWSLANLKTVRFSDADLAAMAGALGRGDLAGDDRLHLQFALGKAFEDAGRDAEAFAHYAQGNALRRAELRYEADETTRHMRRSKALFTQPFFAARAGCGSGAPDPIFVVGLPRAGSTLIEQILSSHSQVEGTQELPDIISIARRLGRAEGGAYPEALASLTPEALRALGEEYLARAQVHRKLGRPFFIDKMPNNFAHLGLIHLILPNAKVIDARRHPLGCCFSAFKQHFAQGQSFTYGLEDVGRYYADYVELMAHFDAVLPGRVHRVIYEEMVADPEAQVRALLAHCGLPFEDACLRFYENDRAVRTASSEQVRQPIFRDAADHWRRFEPWLDPLKASLGSVLDNYPDAPAYPA
jgi:tetratricopeptide (TPR) repeat protein